MKINKMKAMVGVLAVTSVASLVGSVSGTMAWLQYNTRARAEMYGTTAKTTENLQIRTITYATGEAMRGKFADKATLESSVATPANGDKAVTEDGKVYTYTTAWDDGVMAAVDDQIEVSPKFYKWNGSNWAEIDAKTYNPWKSTLLPEDINAAARHKLVNDEFKPVTNPAATDGNALSNFYSHPLAGHEKYNAGDHKWKPAKDSDYLQVDIQFRVLDVDGVAGDGTLAKPLYLTDLTVNDTVGGKSVASALRFHLSNTIGGTNRLLGLGDTQNNASYKYVTHGHLDLDGDGDYDSIADEPAKYSWSANATDLLDYGSDLGGERTYVNVLQENAGVKQFLANQDQYGALSGGVALGTTTAGTSASPVADDGHLTFTLTMWLEGWHTMDRTAADASKGTYTEVTNHTVAGSYTEGKIYSDAAGLAANKMFLYMGVDGGSNPIWKDIVLQNGDVYSDGTNYKVYNASSKQFDAAGANVKSALWDDLKTVGAKFNIGMSFGVPALAPIQE